MSTHICSQCGHEEHIFGAGGGGRMADKHGVPLLGSLPLDISIREQADGGRPTVMADPEGAVARTYREIAVRAVARLATRSKDYARHFPKITVVND
jgi:ATP-binding protein involved in chromosome partitioning